MFIVWKTQQLRALSWGKASKEPQPWLHSSGCLLCHCGGTLPPSCEPKAAWGQNKGERHCVAWRKGGVQVLLPLVRELGLPTECTMPTHLLSWSQTHGGIWDLVRVASQTAASV